MTKAELIDQIHSAQSVSDAHVAKKTINVIIEQVFGRIQDALKDDGRFSYPGFGTFTRKIRAARTGINPKTKEAIQIPETTTVTFKPASRFKEDLGKATGTAKKKKKK